MRHWFRTKVPKDERIEALKLQVYKEAYLLVIAISLASLIYKSWILNYGLGDTLFELLVILASSLYYTVRSVFLGVVAAEAEMHERVSTLTLGRQNALAGLALGVILALFFGIRSAILYGGVANGLKYFLIVTLAGLVIYVPLWVVFLTVGSRLALKASERASRKDREL